MRGFQPAAHLVPKYADGGLVQRALGLFGGRKKQIDEAVKVASQDTRQASAPAPEPVKTTQDGKFDEKRVNANNPAGIGFADGGRVRPRGFVVGPGTETSDSIPARLSAGEYVLPADTVKAVGVDQLDALREATHKPVKGEGAKAARGFFAGGTPGGLDEAYNSWQDKKTPWYMPTPAGNMEERTAEAAYTQALRNSYSGNSSPSATGQPGGPAPKSVPTPDAAPSPVAQQQSAFNASTAKDPTYGLAPTKVNAQPTTQPAENPAPQANAPQEVSPGAYRHGRGQYSDQATGMGFSPGFTGKPNAQNDAAAEALSARSQQESTNRLAQQQYQREVADAQAINAAGTQYAPNSGLQYQWMSDIRDPRNLALQRASVGSRIFSSKGEEMMANKARQARVAGVQAAIGSQMHDAQAAQTAALQSKNTLAGNLATEQMRQDGENQRSARRFAVDQQRLGIEAGKEAQESTARGFDIRAAQRREGVLQRYDAAKTDQEREQLQRQYPDVFGKESANRFTVVPGGQEWDAAAGAMRNVPGRVFNNQTGQFVEQAAGAAPMPKVGETHNGYRYKGGDPNDKASWQQI